MIGRLVVFASLLVGNIGSLAAATAADLTNLERVRVPTYGGGEFAAYPSIDRLHDGRLLCVYSVRSAQRGNKLILAGAISADNALTWSEPFTLIDSPDGNDYDSSIIVIDDRVIVTATTTPLDGIGITTSRITAVRSDDGGRTWSPPYVIESGRRYTSGKVNNGIVLDDGTALLGFTWEKNLETGPRKRLENEGEMEEVNAVLLSFDRGRTWASSESVELETRRSPHASHAINGVCEPALVACDDGSVFMLCRTGLTRLYGTRSHDGGRSWSAPTPTPLVSHNAPAALCRFGAARPGILAVWNDSPEDRWPLAISASYDGCRSWTRPLEIARIKGWQSSYPGCVEAHDGTIVIVYQQDRQGGRDILGIRLKAEILAAQEQTPTPAVADSRRMTKLATGLEADPCQESYADIAPRSWAHFDAMPKPATLPDGTLAAYFVDHEGPGLAATPDEQFLYARYSRDNGQTWSEAATLFDLPAKAGGFGYFVPLVDQQGEVHFFLLCDANTGVVRPRPADSGKSPYEPLARQRLDVWHVSSRDGRTLWTTPRQIWEGRAGDLQSVIQMSNGRIVLPLSFFVHRNWSNRGSGPQSYTYTGQFDTTALYSDDSGKTWQTSDSTLRVATPNLSAYGAVEPVVLELIDGRLWMLLRTQLGRFYESFSIDGGASWSPAEPTSILSSDSPVGLVRLADKRIVMLWNHCQRHPYAQGSRQVLHASVSADEGATWTGYREILRDPHRVDPPPPHGDHGVSYPFLTVAPDGAVIYSLWVQTGRGRSLERLDPAWLDATGVEERFENGLEAWSSFGTRGVSIQTHPDDAERHVLVLAPEDTEWPTAAVWNFPMGRSGRLRMKLFMEPHAPDLSLELADHFSPPSDQQSVFHSLFATKLSLRSNVAAQPHIAPNQWQSLEIRWNCDESNARLRVGDGQWWNLTQQHQRLGPSYLRLSLNSNRTLAGRVLIEAVTLEVIPNI